MNLQSFVQWMQMGLDGHLKKDSTYGDEEPKTARSCFAFRIGSTTMGCGKRAPTFNMLELWNGLQEPDCNNK